MVFILFVLGAIIAVIVLGLVFLPSFIDESAIIALAQEQVRKATGGELTVEGDTEIAIFPRVVLALEDTTVDLPPQGPDGSRMLAEISTVDINLAIIPLLMGDSEVGEVRLADATVTLFNSDGAVATQLSLPELVAQGLNTANSPMTLTAALELTNLEGGEPMKVTLDGAVRIPSAVDRITIDTLRTVVRGALTEPLTATLSGTVLLSPMKANLALLAQLPGGDIDGDLIYAAAESPQIDLTFTTERLDLDQLTPAGSPAAAPETTSVTEAKAPPLPLPVGPLRDLDLRLAVTANSLISSGQEITSAQLLLRVVNGISDLKYLRGVLHEGQLDTSVKIDVRKPVVTAGIKGGLKGVELNSLLTSFGAPDQMLGRVDMDWDIDTQGRTDEDLKLGLDGDLNVSGRGVELTSVSVQDLMCQSIAKVNQEELSKEMPATTQISALGLIVTFDDQQARLTNLALATQGVEMAGEGAASLRDLNFRAGIAATIDESLQELDPACRVKERYTAIDWPISCAGNLTGEPRDWCRVDLETIVKQLLENEAKSQIQKKAGGVLKKLFGR